MPASQSPAPRPAPGPALRRAPVQRRSAERLTRILDACAELLDETGYEQLSTRAVAARAGVPIGSVYRFFGNKRAMAAALAHRNLDHYAARVAAGLAAIPAAPAATPVGAQIDGVSGEGTSGGSGSGSNEGGSSDGASGGRAAPQVRPADAGRVIDAVLDAYLAMKRTVPGFGLVDFGVPGPCAIVDATDATDAGDAGDAGGTEDAEGVPDVADAPCEQVESDFPGESPNPLVAARICGLIAGPLGRPADDTLRRKVLVCVEATDALLRLAFRADPSGDPALVAETRALLHAYLAPALVGPGGAH
ncbi:TetR/AcrR family transcriptional regulator [Streptomyces sp. NPDC046203]|uniref:TetR/AcrR family transcriptional regulator n=1 Tax=Streptomyces sp. NPDC046203 TaxID=3154602 RepID=UPI00340BFF7E